MKNITELVLDSWQNTDGNVNTYEQILSLINDKIAHTAVSVEETLLSQPTNWFLDQDNGTIHNQNNSFFRL